MKVSLPINQVLCGPCVEVMQTFPKECVDLVMFSPPYWGLRDYGAETATVWGGKKDCEHEWGNKILPAGYRSNENRHSESLTPKAIERRDEWQTSNVCVLCGAWKGQLGLEPHPSMYIDHMVTVCGAVKRVLKKSGSLYLNLGDTYYSDCTVREKGSHAFLRKGDPQYNKYLRSEVQKGKAETHRRNFPRDRKEKKAWLQPKQKLLMPSRLAIALQAEGWILRNDIIWHKPNHMPSSVKDRLTNAYEHIFHFVKSRRYFYDLDAIRQPHKEMDRRGSKRISYKGKGNPPQRLFSEDADFLGQNPLGKNPSDIFQSKKEPYLSNNPHRMRLKAEDHIALDPSKPMDLSHPKGKNPSDIIKVGSHHGSSLTKGRATYYEDYPIESDLKGKNPSDFWSINTKPFPQAHFAVYPEAICERPIKSSCPNGGIVLDPMCGAGTTLVVAQKLGRRWIGIDLKAEYVGMAKKRLMKECSQRLEKFIEIAD